MSFQTFICSIIIKTKIFIAINAIISSTIIQTLLNDLDLIELESNADMILIGISRTISNQIDF